MGKQQRIIWDFFERNVNQYKPFDVAVLNGDLIDGKGRKSGGSELLTADRVKQALIAHQVFRHVEAPKVEIVAGTPFHSGDDEDWESVIASLFLADGVDCEFHGHGFFECNGRNLDIKHKVGNSTVHHGRFTPMQKEIDANVWWHLWDVEPLADIAIRGHVHSHLQLEQDFKYGFVLPALCGLGDKYGSRQCAGRVEFGFLILDIPDDKFERIKWEWAILPGKYQQVDVKVL